MVRINHLVTCLIIFASISVGVYAHAQEIVLPPEVIKRQNNIPDAVLYRVLFHHAAAFKDKADDVERLGRDASSFRNHLAHKLNLSPDQVITLNTVALEYREDAADTERQLNESVARFHAQYGVLPEGQPRPPLPPEAAYLLSERDEITLAARDRFHSRLGDAEFGRIDALIKHNLLPGGRPSGVEPQTHSLGFQGGK